MDDLSLAWRNVWRNPRRSILTLMAIGFAAMLLVFMLSFQFGAYEDMINASVRLATGHLQVQAPGFNDRPKIRKTIQNVPDVLAALSRTRGITAFSPRSQTFVLASAGSRTRGVLAMGVDPETEKNVSTLPGQIRQGRYLSADAPNTVIVGQYLARRLNIGIGRELTLLGNTKDGSIAATVVTVRGIFQSGIDAFDRSTLQMPLADFDRLFAMGGAVHAIVATTDRLKHIGPIKTALRAEPALNNLAVLDWADLTPGLKQSIQLDLVSGIIMYIILIIVVAFSILNTFLMAVFERTREFGVMMAIGTPPGRLVRIMLMESLAMTGVGLIGGMVLGYLVTAYFSSAGIPMGGAADLLAQYGISGRLYPRLSALSLLTGPLIIGVVTFLTALFPALRIPRLKPVEAMKAV